MSRSYKQTDKNYNEAYRKKREEARRDLEREHKEAYRRAWFEKQDQHEHMDDQARRGK